MKARQRKVFRMGSGLLHQADFIQKSLSPDSFTKIECTPSGNIMSRSGDSLCDALGKADQVDVVTSGPGTNPRGARWTYRRRTFRECGAG